MSVQFLANAEQSVAEEIEAPAAAATTTTTRPPPDDDDEDEAKT
jgi:hypothetical protein